MALQDRIKEAMRRHPELSQADIARACKVKTPSVAAWINGDTQSLKPEPARLGAALFGCDQNWLASGVGSPNWSSKQPAAPASNVINLPAVPDCIRLLAEKLAAQDEDTRAITISALMGWLQRGAPITSIEQLRRLLGEFSPPAADHKLAGNGAT